MTFGPMGAMQAGKALEKDNLVLFFLFFCISSFQTPFVSVPVTLWQLRNRGSKPMSSSIPTRTFICIFSIDWETRNLFGRTRGPLCPLRVCWVMDTTGWQCSSCPGLGAELLLQGALFWAGWMASLALPRADEGPVGATEGWWSCRWPSLSANQSTFPREVLVWVKGFNCYCFQYCLVPPTCLVCLMPYF